jgi:hypothetical protein
LDGIASEIDNRAGRAAARAGTPGRWVVALCAGLGAGLLAIAAPAAAAGPGLGPGESAFWDGETVSGNVERAELCGVQGPCFSYPLDLAVPGARLRVAIDTPSREDSFQFDVIDPTGAVAASERNSNQFNEEVFVKSPAAGAWTVRVIPKGATRAFFRLRAKLEAELPARAPGKVPLLPNLKTVPPYELGFVAPANPGNGLYPPDTVNPPADAAGVHPLSCTADEMAPKAAGGFEAKRCLRLTSGPINVGAGPYDMRFTFAQDIAEGEGELSPQGGTIQRGPISQAIHFSDGSFELRPAGTYSFHVTHGHFHDDNVLTYDLLRVTDAVNGVIEPAGGGTKSGFCPADQLFGDWREFHQQKSGTFGEGDSAAGGNCFSPTSGFIGLTVGWGDIYRWQRPGQYVEFGSNGDGLYVVRATVDKHDETRETDEADNSSYALARVVGEDVRILERGQGQSPWDPAKVIFRGAGPADRGDPIGGPPAPPCTVPKLRGRTLSAARAALRRAGCTLGEVRVATGAKRRAMRRALVVRTQRPTAGAVRPAGGRVKVRLDAPRRR